MNRKVNKKTPQKQTAFKKKLSKHDLHFLKINNSVNQDQYWIFKAKVKGIKAYQIVSNLLHMLE